MEVLSLRVLALLVRGKHRFERSVSCGRRLGARKDTETNAMNDYPENWDEIAREIKDAAQWKCERCLHEHELETGYVLTVHHLDGDKANCEKWNLAALCQRCHLHIQAKVKMDQLFFAEILDVSPWFKPHLEGFLKSKEKRNEPV